jgi:hypothetical protein
MIARFGLGGRDVADRREEATVVVPVDPFQGGVLDRLEGALRPASVDDLCLEQAVDRLRQGVVVAVTDAADRRLDAGSGQALGVPQSQVLGGFKWSSQRLGGG